jgi:hypothetical protein
LDLQEDTAVALDDENRTRRAIVGQSVGNAHLMLLEVLACYADSQSPVACQAETRYS